MFMLEIQGKIVIAQSISRGHWEFWGINHQKCNEKFTACMKGDLKKSKSFDLFTW